VYSSLLTTVQKRTMVKSSIATLRSSEACVSPSQVPVEAEDEDSSCSYHFPMLKTFMSPV
jgi:hypothetical protein